MIVRIAHFRFPDEEHRAAAELNGTQRVWPALVSQPGARAIYYGRAMGLEAYSISLWDDRVQGDAAAAYMNGRPLLPGQRPEMLPTPDSTSFYEVVSSLERGCTPAAGRIGYLSRREGVSSDAADAWARAELRPMIERVAGLCQAYFLRPETRGDEPADRISLTFWESAEAMAAAGRSIGAWQANQAAGDGPGYVDRHGVTLSDLLTGVVPEPAG